jgi:hypothetical protein
MSGAWPRSGLAQNRVKRALDDDMCTERGLRESGNDGERWLDRRTRVEQRVIDDSTAKLENRARAERSGRRRRTTSLTQPSPRHNS